MIGKGLPALLLLILVQIPLHASSSKNLPERPLSHAQRSAPEDIRLHYRDHNIIAFFSTPAEREWLFRSANRQDGKQLPPRLALVKELMGKAFARTRSAPSPKFLHGSFPDYLFRFPEAAQVVDWDAQGGGTHAFRLRYFSLVPEDGWHGTGLKESEFSREMLDSLLPAFQWRAASKPRRMPRSWSHELSETWVKFGEGWYLDRSPAIRKSGNAAARPAT